MPRRRTRKPAQLEVTELDPVADPPEEWKRALVEPVFHRLFNGPKPSTSSVEPTRSTSSTTSRCTASGS